MIRNSRVLNIYQKLYQLGKTFNETATIKSLHSTAVEFATSELNFEKAVLFEHNLDNGWFYVADSRGYNNPQEQKILSIISLLLSGEIIEFLRTKKEPIIHTKNSFKSDVANFLRALHIEEAYIELIGGDIDIPHALLVVGNSTQDSNYTKPDVDEMIILALGNFTIQLSNTINNVLFYNKWKKEKVNLEKNIEIRTKIIQEQKEQFEAIYKTSKDGIALIDVETTAFLDVNPAYSEITGFSREELLRTSCMNLTIEEDFEKSREAIDEVLRVGFIKDFSKRCIAKDGSIILSNMSLSLMPDKERILITRATCRL